MPIIAKASGDGFTLCPQGTHAAVCVDVVDLGMVESQFAGEKKSQHKVRIVWQIDEINPANGKPFTAGKRYTLSLHEKATLRKDLESWRGKPFTEQECEGFDLENLLSVGALLNVIHEHKNGKTYDNVVTIMRMPRGMSTPVPREYVRKCDRQPEAAQDYNPAVTEQEYRQPDPETYYPSDDDMPF